MSAKPLTSSDSLVPRSHNMKQKTPLWSPLECWKEKKETACRQHFCTKVVPSWRAAAAGCGCRCFCWTNYLAISTLNNLWNNTHTPTHYLVQQTHSEAHFRNCTPLNVSCLLALNINLRRCWWFAGTHWNGRTEQYLCRAVMWCSELTY